MYRLENKDMIFLNMSNSGISERLCYKINQTNLRRQVCSQLIQDPV